MNGTIGEATQRWQDEFSPLASTVAVTNQIGVFRAMVSGAMAAQGEEAKGVRQLLKAMEGRIQKKQDGEVVSETKTLTETSKEFGTVTKAT